MITVTVIIPFKDNLNYLFLAINSVLSQTFRKFKIIIIYDKTDLSDYNKLKYFLKRKKIIQKFDIKILLNRRNMGAGMSRNIAINKSKSKYIAFLDSDDLWAKDKLKKQIDFMIREKLVISHTSYFVMDYKGKIISLRNAFKKLDFSNLIKSCDIGLSTVILDLNFVKKHNLFFPKIKTKEDYILWLKIVKKIKVIQGLNKKLSYYRKSKNSLSSNIFLNLKNGFKVYKNYMKFSNFKSFFYLVVLSLNYIKKSYFQ